MSLQDFVNAVKHLPGKHPQKSHDSHKGGGGSKIGNAARAIRAQQSQQVGSGSGKLKTAADLKAAGVRVFGNHFDFREAAAHGVGSFIGRLQLNSGENLWTTICRMVIKVMGA